MSDVATLPVTLPAPVEAATLTRQLRNDPDAQPLVELVDGGSRVDYPKLTAVRNQLKLLETLRQQGIKVYDPADISAYKSRMVKQTVAGLNNRWKVALCLAPFGITVLAFITFMVSVSIMLATDETNSLAAMIAGCSLVTILVGGIIGLMVIDHVTVDEVKWRRYALKDFKPDIPLKVLQLADYLQRELPAVMFYVDQLEVTRRPLDPLLFVSLQGAEYCIAVWDEPQFQAEPRH